MGGAVVSVPRIPFVYEPPPAEKYVFRMVEGGSTARIHDASVDSGKENSRKRSGSIHGIPAVPEMSRRGSKIGLLQPQNSSLLTGELHKGMSVGALKAQASLAHLEPGLSRGMSVGSLKAQASNKVMLSLTANNSEDAPAPLARKGSVFGKSSKRMACGQRVSAKHAWILKGGSITPRSASEFEIGRVLGKYFVSENCHRSYLFCL
jgi:hypothetical protein